MVTTKTIKVNLANLEHMDRDGNRSVIYTKASNFRGYFAVDEFGDDTVEINRFDVKNSWEVDDTLEHYEFYKNQQNGINYYSNDIVEEWEAPYNFVEESMLEPEDKERFYPVKFEVINGHLLDGVE